MDTHLVTPQILDEVYERNKLVVVDRLHRAVQNIEFDCFALATDDLQEAAELLASIRFVAHVCVYSAVRRIDHNQIEFEEVICAESG